jgi:hypothetical protein
MRNHTLPVARLIERMTFSVKNPNGLADGMTLA